MYTVYGLYIPWVHLSDIGEKWEKDSTNIRFNLSLEVTMHSRLPFWKYDDRIWDKNVTEFRDALANQIVCFFNIVQTAFDPPPLVFEHLCCGFF